MTAAAFLAVVAVVFFAATAVVAFFAAVFLVAAGAAAAAVAARLVAARFTAAEVPDLPGVSEPLGAFLTDGPSFGSFLLPLTRSLKPWPGRNRGTEVFLTLTFSPVCGLRAKRAERSTFSKVPKPVTDTRSPATTARTMVSSTASTASAAALRPPSCSATASTS